MRARWNSLVSMGKEESRRINRHRRKEREKRNEIFGRVRWKNRPFLSHRRFSHGGFIARMRAIARSATLPNGELRTRRRKGERDGRMDERASIRRVHVHGTHTRARAARRLIIEISHVGPPRACGRPCACTPMQRSRDAFMRVRRNLCT